MRPWIAAALGTLACSGCPSSASFQCTGDEQCHSDRAAGVCQPDGYCSFDDPQCESGQRYGEQSGPLAGQCVAPPSDTDPAMTTEPGTSETVPPTSTSTPPLDSSDSVTTGDPDGTTTSVDPSTSTDDGRSETTGEVPQCAEVYVDHFDNGMIEPTYDQEIGPGMTMTEAGGQLRFGFDGTAMSGYSFIGDFFGQLTSHRYWVEQATILPGPTPASVDMCLTAGVWHACIVTFDGMHEARLSPEDMQVMVGATPADPVTARFVAISRVGDEVRYEVSGDGVVWQTFHTEPSPLEPADDTYVFLGAGSWEPVGAGDEIAIEAIGICEL